MSHSPTKRALLTLLTLIAFCLTSTNAGTLKTYGSTNYIDASIANKGQLADYTFSFIPETMIPAKGILRVIFPTQYSSGLGISTPSCSIPCTVSGYTVDFTFQSEVLGGTATSVTIYSVKNPAVKGGTGNFQLMTLSGVNVLDDNLIFDVIGIADSVGTLTSTLVSVDSSGVSSAGETTRYAFSFKVSQQIPSGSYFKLTILDSNFGLTRFPACNAYAINGKIIQGKFFCETVGRTILVKGLGADIPASQDVGLSVAMVNPKYSGTTSTFTVAVLRGGTNVIYDVKTGIPGVSITAGVISEISMVQVDTDAIQSRKKVMDYIVSFHLKNSLPSGSVISLQFPPSFLIDTSVAKVRYVRFGVDDISEDSTVGLSVDTSNILRLTNFVPIDTPQMMSLYLRLVNPDNVGETTPVNIRTYLDALQTILIDEDTTSTYTTIQDITSPILHSINNICTDCTGAKAPAAYTVDTIEFNIQPTISVPFNGVLKIRVPSEFTIGTIVAASCQVTNAAGTYVNAAACTSSGNTITLVLPTTITFPLGASRKFSLNSLIHTPSLNGTFLFDITSYLIDGSTVIESWTDYLTVTPAPFTSWSITTLEAYQGRTTVLTCSFTAPLTVPAGIVQNKASDVKGFIELEFSSTSTDLGLGATAKKKISCKALTGLTPISGDIVCYLIPGTTPLIRVENFQEITAGTAISFSIPQILNPNNNYDVKMKAISLVDRVRTELNSVTQTLVNPGASAAALTTPVALANPYVFTSLEVSQTTILTLNPNIAVNVNGPGTFIVQLPLYDIGWIPSSDTIVCTMGGTIYPCIRYYGADWITIRLPTGNTFTSGSSISIQGLKVPRYSYTYVGGVTLRYITDAANQERIRTVMANFPVPTVPQFNQGTLIANKKSKGSVDASYTIEFIPPNDIPEGASIIITFPFGYNLLSSSPAVSFSSPDMTPISTLNKVSFTASIDKLTVTGFKTLPALDSFSVVVSGLKNPSTLSLSEIWEAQVIYNTYQMVYHADFDKFVFTPAVSAGAITFNSIAAFPLNANEEVTYTIDFVPSTEIPAGGEVRITFPSANYNALPSPPDCTVSGGITTFTSCTLSGTTYTVVLDSRYSGGGIILKIRNILNPDRGTTEGFVIKTYYDGVILDDTDTSSTTGRTVTLVDAGDRLIVNTLTFDPRNEGEQSTYTFSFLTANSIESSMYIHIIFPDVYDKTLGETISCAATTGLYGDISCTVSNRVVIVTGFDTYLPDATRPITIQVYGVVNPNKQSSGTGQFKIGTIKSDSSSYTDYNSVAGSLVTLDAPGWAVLYNVTAANLYTRLESTYEFNFTSFAGIPKTSSSGAILVDFPTEFEIPDGDVNCDTETTDFSPVITCSFERNRMSITGQTEDYTGNVGFTVRNLENPIEPGAAKNIVLKVYDGLNFRIIERSFKNLDPFMFTYTYPGPLIIVNNDEPITTIRGTETNEIYITVDEPCALNLTLKPSNPGFSIIPFNIDLSLGQTKAKFRLSVPQSFPEGTYYIQWETFGEIIPAYYTPIKDTPIIVTKQTEMVIQAPTLNYIPYGGNSLPSAFTVVNGPDIGITITVNFLVTYPGLTLSTNTLTFEQGQVSESFIIYSSSDTKVTGGTKVEKGTIVLSLAGVNKDLYVLSATSLEFRIIDTDLVVPEVDDFSVSEVTMTSAKISVTISEVCMVYYMRALMGTVTPTLAEIKSQGPANYTTTQSRYGVLQIDTSLTAMITYDDLVAETPYVVFMYIVDRGDNIVGPYNLTFTTLDRYNGVDFTLKFKEYALNEAEKQIIISAVSFTLSLYVNKLQERIYFSNTEDSDDRLLSEVVEEETLPHKALGFLDTNIESTEETVPQLFQERNNSRNLQEEIFVLMYLQLAATPESTVYPSPKKLATSLNDKSNQLLARMPTIDTEYKIEPFEYVRKAPAFPSIPTLKGVDITWGAFTGKLNDYGFIFVVCVKLEEDHGVPTPYQILHGFDNRNIPMPSTSVEISEPYVSFVFNVTELDPLTNYTAYIIGGSTHPGYPDLMEARDIVQIPFRTEPPNTIARLNIKGEPILKMAYHALFVIIALWMLI